jgi:hypothetical protein
MIASFALRVHLLAHNRQIVMGIGVIRIDSGRQAKLLARFIQPAQVI